jgi:hypothetical protein
MKQYYNWYKKPEVKFQIIKFLYKRELAMLHKGDYRKSIRMLKCHNVQSFDFIINRMLAIEKNSNVYNFYYSLASYINGIPHQSAKLTDRDNREWTVNHYKDMVGYDFLIDIDAGDNTEVDIAYESSIEIKSLLDKHKVPYELRFSGCGFHFVIPFEYIIDLIRNEEGMVKSKIVFNPMEENNIYAKLRKIANYFHNEVSELVDYSIYDSRRICKIPYTLAVYDNNITVCLPFIGNKQFKRFDYESYKLMSVFHITNEFRNQDPYLFNKGGGVKWLKDILQNGR